MGDFFAARAAVYDRAVSSLARYRNLEFAGSLLHGQPETMIASDGEA
jgi:hypothetical protein